MFRSRIRNASEVDAKRIGAISFQAHSLCNDWSLRCPDVKAQDWVEVQTDLVLQHFGTMNDVVVVAEDENGEVVGYVFGRVLGKGLPGAAKKKPLAGQNTVELGKMSNASFIDSLVEKYDRILWIRDFGVLPDKQGSGIGKALMAYVIDEAQRRKVNIGLAGAAEAVRLYEKLGFEELVPARFFEGSTIPMYQLAYEVGFQNGIMSERGNTVLKRLRRSYVICSQREMKIFRGKRLSASRLKDKRID
ncbi:hypothetical protein QFC22_000800 [Naganishia vaughanmartiniae]|uniref:Uncharacterized protein n=1 Tax=Naganishia vaughanmartiniae TaxID=1424756 RepID=A0ACC2XK48_9TREE|nr:hypothetical protein QFC22_000800 [Naganishia vaughanmartiniae]